MRSLLYLGGVCILVALGMLLSFSHSVFTEVPVSYEQRTVVITPGETVKQISADLVSRDIVLNDFWFRTYVWLTRNEGRFIAGTFALPTELNATELVNILTTRGEQETYTIQILEGWGIQDIGDYLEKRDLFSKEALYALVGNPLEDNTLNKEYYLGQADIYADLLTKKAGKSAEGYLFPDTYEIFKNATLADIVSKMFGNFNRKVTPDMIAEAERQGKDFYDVLIMASIIEAEVPHEEDRAIVSDIFWSRLEAGVALQSDATLNYAIRGDNPSLTFEQLKIDSPYNSYLYRGLPPAPIGNPGVSAIQAALYPADTDYFYFLSKPDGETVFSSTLEQHNAAKNKYLR